MRNHRDDVVACAVSVLDRYGLADLSMRRIASELGVAPSALYHHFANKQQLLGAVARHILASAVVVDDGPWRERATRVCVGLRDAMLAYRDGAELVATIYSFGMIDDLTLARVRTAMASAEFTEEFADVVARTLLHFVFGHVSDEQTQIQADSLGVIQRDVEASASALTPSATFAMGVRLILNGVGAHNTSPHPAVG